MVSQTTDFPKGGRPYKGRLILFCGIPGSGKTTIASRIAAELPLCLHVQTDAVRAMVPKPNYSADESRLVYSAAYAVAGQGLRWNYDVILDGTFPRHDFRKRAFAELDGYARSHLTVYVVCDLETAMKRNSQRQIAVPDETVERIRQSFEPPSDALVIDSAKMEPDEAAPRIIKTLSS